MIQRRRYFALILIATTCPLLFSVGCKPPEPPAPNVKELVRELDELHLQIAETFEHADEHGDEHAGEHDDEPAEGQQSGSEPTAEEGDHDHIDGDAHDALHRVAAILNTLTILQSAPDLTAEQCRQIASTASDLMSVYGELDEAIHSDSAPDYASLKDQIEAGISALKEQVP